MAIEYLIIFFARICDVSLATVRMIMVVKGKRYPAAAIGCIEASIYIAALSRIMSNITDPWKILAYGLGFGCGTLLGSFIEEKLALGHVALEVIPTEESQAELLKAMRTMGYGVTVVEGKGMTGVKMVMLVSADRKTLPTLMSLIEEFSPGSFVTVTDTRSVRGGVLPTRTVMK